MAKKQAWFLEEEELYQAERLKHLTGAEYDEQLKRLEQMGRMKNEEIKAKKRGSGTKNALIGAGGTVLGAVLGEVIKVVAKKVILKQ